MKTIALLSGAAIFALAIPAAFAQSTPGVQPTPNASQTDTSQQGTAEPGTEPTMHHHRRHHPAKTTEAKEDAQEAVITQKLNEQQLAKAEQGAQQPSEPGTMSNGANTMQQQPTEPGAPPMTGTPATPSPGVEPTRPVTPPSANQSTTPSPDQQPQTQ